MHQLVSPNAPLSPTSLLTASAFNQSRCSLRFLGPQVFQDGAVFAFMLASLGFISLILSSNFGISSVRVVPGQDALAFIEASARPYTIIDASLGPPVVQIQP